jgi:hypothetical protein
LGVNIGFDPTHHAAVGMDVFRSSFLGCGARNGSPLASRIWRTEILERVTLQTSFRLIIGTGPDGAVDADVAVADLIRSHRSSRAVHLVWSTWFGFQCANFERKLFAKTKYSEWSATLFGSVNDEKSTNVENEFLGRSDYGSKMIGGSKPGMSRSWRVVIHVIAYTVRGFLPPVRD